MRQGLLVCAERGLKSPHGWGQNSLLSSELKQETGQGLWVLYGGG